ncbi:hypothetical protein NQ318_020258 [Aromia moschata]|uniref:Uncharacterized protein n=1 Tax=Aromia moschata TaxID=1265417 RepID=A0AAV8Z9V7_9CUCU|nr:hypothetical protein NQ318_020258 [Aromia moschata]
MKWNRGGRESANLRSQVGPLRISAADEPWIRLELDADGGKVRPHLARHLERYNPTVFLFQGNMKQHMLTHKIRDMPQHMFENKPPSLSGDDSTPLPPSLPPREPSTSDGEQHQQQPQQQPQQQQQPLQPPAAPEAAGPGTAANQKRTHRD